MRVNYDFFEDSGHGWLRVPLNVLRSLGIDKKISAYSYKHGKFAYLEEDVDATIFIKAMDSHGFRLKIKNHTSDGYSPIRNYTPYRRKTRNRGI